MQHRFHLSRVHARQSGRDAADEVSDNIAELGLEVLHVSLAKFADVLLLRLVNGVLYVDDRCDGLEPSFLLGDEV